MRIGPVTLRNPIQMASRNGTKPTESEIGWSGTEIFSGRLSPAQDYNDALNPPGSYDIFDRMRRGDGTVAAALRVIKLPLLNADWYIEPASDSAQDREIADFIETNLKEGLNISWRAVLRQIMLHLDYGNAPFEKVWRVENGQVYLRKLAFRHPKTITKWLTDEKGGLAGIEQTTSPDFRPTTIDVSKLIVFINELEGANFHGVSILRPAYKHWYYVDGLERVQAIGIEKRAGGVDVIMLSGDAATPLGKRDAEAAAQTMHLGDKMYYVGQKEQNEYEIKGIEGDVLDPGGALERHDLRIVRSMITEFLAMGSGSTGSLAMHKDKSSMSMLALGGVANEMCDTFQMHLIRPWVDYNWAVDAYPRLRYTHIDARPLAELADAVLKFSQAKALTPTIEVENNIRALLDVPPITEDEYDAEPAQPAPLQAPNMEPAQAIAARIRADRAELRRRRETVNA